jgi:hypothetical protein
MEQLAQAHLQRQQMVETEVTLYLQQLRLLVVVVDKVMLLRQAVQPRLVAQVAVEALLMVLAVLERLIKDTQAVAQVVVQLITLVAAVVVLAQLEKPLQAVLQKAVLVA